MKMKKAFSLILCAALLLCCFCIPAAQAKIWIADFYVYFTPWQGEGDAEATLDVYGHAEYDKFLVPGEFLSLKTTYTDAPVDPANYTVETENGKTVLRLKESYLKTLDDGFYYYTAEFRQIEIDAKLAVVTEQKDGSDICIEFPPYQNTGGASVWLHADGVHFSWSTFSSLRLGERELTQNEDYRVGEWAGGVYVTLYESLLETFPYGEYRFTADFLNVKNVTLLLKIENPHRTGDVDGDGVVTSKDARLALRMSAQLDPQYGAGALAADIDRSGGAESAEARQILRVAAKIDSFRVEVEIFSHAGHPELDDYPYVISGLRAAATQYRWEYTVEPAEGLTVTEQTVNRSAPGEVGLADAQRFLVSANKPGDYTLRLVQKTDWEEEWIDEIEFVFHVKDIDKF